LKKVTITLAALITIFFYNITFAQFESAFYYLRMPRSVKAYSMGQQGVASLSSSGAMQYNPAGLVNSDSVSISYFNCPYMLNENYRFYAGNYSMRLGKYGNIGVEYTDMDYGEYELYQPKERIIKYHPYEKSLAIAYANRIGKEFSVGAEVRFAWEKTFDNNNVYFEPLISAGVMYQPEVLKNRLNLGFSLTDFGSAVNSYEELYWYDNGENGTEKISYAAPANFNLGLSILPVTNSFFDLDFEASISKRLEKGGGFTDGSAQSSYASLFNSWKYFPNDAASSLGLGYIFHPIYLGSDISFIQEMYLGYKSIAPKYTTANIFYHGFNMGLEIKGIKVMAGYTGTWHNHSFIGQYNSRLPNENFEFTLSSDLKIFGRQKAYASYNSPLNILISTGYSFGNVLGSAKGAKFDFGETKFDNNNNWQVSADFYIDENSAITTSLIYGRLKEKDYIQYYYGGHLYGYGYNNDVETFSLESGYRYHPLRNFHPLFVQGAIGVMRLNPVTKTYYYNRPSEYFYKPYGRISVGGIIPLWMERIVVIPKISLRTLLMETFWYNKILYGYNQIEYGINVGYRF